jgi:hypothetical protein
MLTPNITARVKQWNLRPRIWLQDRSLVGLSSIAMETSQRQIIQGVCPALRERDDVIYREAHILPLF